MERDEAIELLKGGPDGVSEWNRRWEQNEGIPDLINADLSRAVLSGAYLIRANLSGANLSRASLSHAILSSTNLSSTNLSYASLLRTNLSGANLSYANLSDANLSYANLIGADLSSADLSSAYLICAYLIRANLSGASLSRAILGYAKLSDAHLSDANLSGADLEGADLEGADLRGAELSQAACGNTCFGDVDLCEVKGLESITHKEPSTVGVDTLVRSRGRIPEAFLRGCGFAPWEVLAAKLYSSELNPPGFAELQYQIFDAWTKGKSMINGCFVSYSWTDAKFVDKFRDCLIAEDVYVWLDRHDMNAGTIQDQVWRAIQIRHVVIIVLSKASVNSDWVENELEMARIKEKTEGRAVLCPIALDDAWKAKIAAKDGPGDPSRQLWRTLQQKLVVDFSGWESEAFEESFQKLLRGLKLNYGPASPGPPARCEGEA